MTTSSTRDPGQQHLTTEAVEAFLYRTEEPAERTVLYHLLACCEACRRVAHPLLELYRAGTLDERTSPAEIDLAVSEYDAREQWEEWEDGVLAGAESAPEMVERLRGEPAWPTWGLVAWLAQRSLDVAPEDPEAALTWAKVAVSGAGRLRADEPAPEEWNMELRAFAQAVLGNAFRVRGELPAAEASFTTAHKALDAYDDPPDFLPFRARILTLEAGLRRHQRRYREALDLLDDAREAWEVVDPAPPTEPARLRLEKARILQDVDDPEAALGEHHAALDLLGPETDPKLRLQVEVELLFLCARMGRDPEVAQRLPAVKDLAERVGGEVDRLRIDWVEAHVHDRTEDDPDSAETVLRRVLDGFCVRHLAYDAALAALDLARLLVKGGRTQELDEIARAVQPIFEALGVGEETRRALRIYMTARAQDAHSLRALGRLGPALLGGRPGDGT